MNNRGVVDVNSNVNQKKELKNQKGGKEVYERFNKMGRNSPDHAHVQIYPAIFSI
jgi:hypothetical protein